MAALANLFHLREIRPLFCSSSFPRGYAKPVISLSQSPGRFQTNDVSGARYTHGWPAGTKKDIGKGCGQFANKHWKIGNPRHLVCKNDAREGGGVCEMRNRFRMADYRPIYIDKKEKEEAIGCVGIDCEERFVARERERERENR